MDVERLRLFSGVFIVLFIIIAGLANPSSPGIKKIRQREEERAEKLLEKGEAKLNEGDLSSAIDYFETIYYRYRRTLSWGPAAYYLGVCYRAKGDYDRAILYFKSVLSWEIPSSGYKRRPYQEDSDDLWSYLFYVDWTRYYYQNYKHYAAVQLSYIYEDKGDFDKARRYTDLAINKYTFVTWCGTCAELHYNSLLQRREWLIRLKEWSLTKEKLYEFCLVYNITQYSGGGYSILLPAPLSVSNSTSYFMKNLVLLRGDAVVSPDHAGDWPAINVTGRGNVTLQISFTVWSNMFLTDDMIFEDFSMSRSYLLRRRHYMEVWSTENDTGEIAVVMDLSVFKYPPEGYYIFLGGYSYSRYSALPSAEFFYIS